MKFVVEHLEEEFYPWCQHEYLNMARITGSSRLMFTNFPHELPEDWPEVSAITTTKSSINDLGIPIEKICLLDSESSEVMTPEDAEKFDYFLFGGILGNVDEFDFDRTSVLRKLGFPTRNLGNMQMTTDTAVRVSKMILVDGLSFDSIPFVDRPEFELEDSVEEDGSPSKLVMNFRYVAGEDGKPLICPEVLQLLKEDADFDLEVLE